MPQPSRSLPTGTDSSRDALTNTLTRPIFLGLLHERRQRAEQSGDAFAVCLLDVDQLQNINDQRGQSAGDIVLAELARRLLAELSRPTWRGAEYTLARYDGDALILLAQPSALSEAANLAEALRMSVAAEPLGDAQGVTVSVGVAQLRIGETVDELLARTERALHLAKQFGRDRVEVSPTPKSQAQRAPIVPLYD